MRKTISTEKAPQAIGTYSQAIQHGNTIYFSGQIPLIPKTMELNQGDIAEQTRQIFRNLEAVAQEAGGTLADFVKLNIFLTDLGNFQIINQVMEEFFTQPYPARAAVGVAALPKDSEVEVDGVMIIG
ncbi:MAG: RidA family protein [Thiotrichaceae bacterium]|nr:RidA family protein [Thiotrichaceae bacterium]